MTALQTPTERPEAAPSGESGRSTPVWRIVAEREVRVKLRDKAFLGSTAFTLLVIVAFFVITSLVGGGPEEYDVAVVDETSTAAVLESGQAALRASGEDGATVTAVPAEDTAAADAAVRDGDADAALLVSDGGGFELVGDEEIDGALRAALTSAVSEITVSQNAEGQGVDLEELYAGSEVSTRLLDPNADESGERSGVAFAFAIVFLFTALGFGMTISQSVVQEKESRVVEILAAAVPIRALLWGKVAGNTVLAVGQVVLIAAVGVAGLAATGRAELLRGVGPAVLWYIVFFVLGFVALASLWSVAGSLASRQEDLGSTTMPGQVLLFVPYFVATLAGEEVRTVFSMLPIVSTMIMPGRMAEGSVPAWQIAVAITATVAAAVVFVRVGERLYQRTLLRTGGKVGYREALALDE